MNGWNKNLKDIGCERKLFECYLEFLWDTTNVQYTVLGRKIYNEETGGVRHNSPRPVDTMTIAR